MAFEEDLTVFFADFGDDGLLAGQPVRGNYTAPGGSVSGIFITEPQFELATASVPADVYEAALVLPQGSFTVREHQPDGTGISLLLLQVAAAA